MFSNNHNIISRDSTHLRHFLVTLLWPWSQVSGQRASVHDHLRRLTVHGGFLFTSWSFTYKKRFKNGAAPSYLPISNCIKPSWTYRGMHLLPQYARRSALSKGAAETWEKCCVGSKTAAGLNAVRLLFKCAIVTRGKKEGKACYEWRVEDGFRMGEATPAQQLWPECLRTFTFGQNN